MPAGAVILRSETCVNGAINGIPGAITGRVGAFGITPGLLDLMVKGMSFPVDIGYTPLEDDVPLVDEMENSHPS